MLSEQEVIDRLRRAVDEAGGQRAFARRYGFTAGYINDVLRGNRAPADRILTAIGIGRRVDNKVEYWEK